MTAPPSTPRAPGASRLALPLLAAGLGAAIFAVTVTHGLVLDSVSLITENEFLHDPETGPLDLWCHHYWHGVPGSEARGAFRPVTTTTLWLTIRLGLDLPAMHHGVNVLLHALACFALALLLLEARLPMPVAAAGALWFAVHPVHVEAVCLVVGRAEILMALFVCGALTLHLRASQAAAPARRAALLAAAFVMGFLAMASKENGVAVVGLVLIVEGWFLTAGGQTRWRGWIRLLVWALWLIPFVAFMAVRWVGLGIPLLSGGGHSVSVLSELPVWQRLSLSLSVLTEVWRVSLPVARLSADYGFSQIMVPGQFGQPRVLLGLFGLALLAGLPLLLPARAGDRTARVALLGLAWFAVAWLPTSHVLFTVGEPFAERWLYLAIAGLLVWAAALLSRVLGQGWVWGSAVGGLTAVMIASAAWHIPAWRDHRSICVATAEASPRSWRALYNAGTAELMTGHYPEALAWYQRYLSQADPRDNRWAAAQNNALIARRAIAVHARTGEYPPLPPVTRFGVSEPMVILSQPGAPTSAPAAPAQE